MYIFIIYRSSGGALRFRFPGKGESAVEFQKASIFVTANDARKDATGILFGHGLQQASIGQVPLFALS